MSYPQKFRLESELAVVTGGGRTNGRSRVEAMADAADALRLRNKGFDVELHLGDVTDAARRDAIANSLAADGSPESIPVNNAGIGQSGIPSEFVSVQDWMRMMEVNLNGVFWCSRAFGHQMIPLDRGTFVNLGSMSGIIACRPQPQTP